MEAEFEGLNPDEGSARREVSTAERFGRWQEMKSANVRRVDPRNACDEFGRAEGRVGWGRTA